MNYWRFYRFLIIGILLLGWAMPQSPEIVPLSAKVGTTVDAEENIIFGIFPAVIGFESAQVFALPDNTYQIKIVYLKSGRKNIETLNYTFDEFISLKHMVDRQPAITAADRQAIYENLTYLRTSEILEDIPTGQFVIVKHTSGKKIRGILLPSVNHHLQVQTPVQVLDFPYHQVSGIAYRESFKTRYGWRKWIYAAGALTGLGLAEIWNGYTEPVPEMGWHYRFMGVLLGLLGGREMYEAVNILTSPKTHFSLSPEEVQRIINFEK